MVTIDQLVDIIAQTVFSVKGAVGLALATIMNKDFRGGQTILFSWLAFVVIVRIVNWFDLRMSTPRNWTPPVKDDIVVVTGASSGLGLLIAGILSERGIKVVAVDCKELPIGIAHAVPYTVDISDREAVDTMAAKVLEMGVPKAIIQCAGVVTGGRLETIDPSAIEQMLRVNYLGNLWVAKAFLPALQTRTDGSMLIGIASSTALAPPVGAGVYAGTKAALRATYESLRYETLGTNVRSLIITPGQLDTAMFSNVQTPAPKLAPVIRGVDLAVKIIDALWAGRTGEIRLPIYARLLPLTAILPQFVVDFMRNYVGIDRAMGV